MNNLISSLRTRPKTFKWLRRLAPALLIIIWFVVAGIGGPTFGKLSSVSTNDQASFLPASAQSTKVQEIQAKFRNSNSIPAIVVVESDTKISPANYRDYRPLVDKMQSVDGVQSGASVAGPIPSQDGKAVQFIVPITSRDEIKNVIADLRTATKENTPAGQTAYVAGPAGLTADLVKAFGGIDGILLLVALSVVFVILLCVYRSLALPFIVLLNSMFALCGAILIVYLMAKWGWIELNGQSQGILSILVIGAATDYSLLLVARYREALTHVQSKWSAMATAFKAAFEPIVASGLTVIVALLCLLFSDLNSNRSLGPIAATGIVFSLLATLTFLPALLVAFGRGSFWPARPKYHPGTVAEAAKNNQDISKLWNWVGRIISRRPRTTWIITALLLIAGGAGILQLKANGVPQTDLILTQSEAVDGQAVLAKHFDSTIGTPMVVIANADRQNTVTTALMNLDGVTAATGYTGQDGRPGQAALPAKVIDGKVLINATLATTETDSDEAEATVRNARTALAAIDPDALVGGTTAIALDTNDTATNDLKKIIPIVLAVIFVILILLLRSIIAPLLLIITVVISYVAALGVSALVFNHIFGFPGADASVPLFGFVFLVALGIDYNIFLMTRVREESKKIGTLQGIIRGLGKTGGVITSAGIVLAATFAALGIIPILFLAQIAFIVAFGVLIDTIIVRSLLVPALSYDIGRFIWWPSKLARNDQSKK
ncbi:MAG TPA: MMPL family transporter [Candidatus Saccharimonadales bacterium]